MSFTDFSCGITVPHLHTGEFVESHYIEYYCPDASGWVKHKSCIKHVHKKARTQTTSTEIIELYPNYSQELLDYMHVTLFNALEEAFMNGD